MSVTALSDDWRLRDEAPVGALRVALVGWGAIARRFAELLLARNEGRVVLCGVCLASDRAEADLPAGVPRIADAQQLAAACPDVVVEAAGREAVSQWGEAALTHSDAFIVASTSAFADDALLERLTRIARDRASQLVIPPGAIGGVDALAAASALALADVAHTIVKPAAAWRGTEAETLLDLDALEEATTFFSGSAREAAARFPQNANVTVITALAGLGLDATRVALVADPGATRNRHVIHARGEFGVLDVAIEARPLPSNPKSSEMTALGLVRLVENRIRPLAR